MSSNRAGHPQRTRKRNRLIFNDNEETCFTNIKQAPSPKKSYVSPSPNKVAQSRATKDTPTKDPPPKPPTAVEFAKMELVKTIQHNKQELDLYIYDNFFYSHIDQAIMLNDNDLESDMKMYFPILKARLFSSAVWNRIESLIGKTRRFSRRMRFDERQNFDTKRHMIRTLQQNKTNDLRSYREAGVPEYIPHFLTVGTRVWAFVRKYGEFFYGYVEGIDVAKNAYRVNFFQNGVGPLTIPDYDVAPSMPTPFVSLDSFLIKSRKIWQLPNKLVDKAKADLLESEEMKKFIDAKGFESFIGDYPARILVPVGKASTLLDRKKKLLDDFKQMNVECERMMAFSEIVSHSFKKKYAQTVLEIAKIDQELEPQIKRVLSLGIQGLSNKVESGKSSSNSNLNKLQEFEVTTKWQQDAMKIFDSNKNKFKTSANTVEKKLLSILCLLKSFKGIEVGAAELQSLVDTVAECRALLSPKNRETFQNCVEVHVNHVFGSLTHLGNVGAFSQSEFLQLEDDSN